MFFRVDGTIQTSMANIHSGRSSPVMSSVSAKSYPHLRAAADIVPTTPRVMDFGGAV
jgi:hypothetical protein